MPVSVEPSGGPPLHRWPVVAVLVASLVAVACSSDDTQEVVTEPVTAGEVVQTVAAPARLEPRERRVVTATVPGRVVELLVEPGAPVEAGQIVLRLESDSVDVAVDQASAAVDAAGALSGIALTPDLSPLVGAVRQQLEATVQPLIATLSSQAQGIEDAQLREQALTTVARLVNSYEETRRRLEEAELAARGSAASATASQRQAAEAQQAQAELALDAARRQRDALELSAPIDGTVEFASSSALGGVGSDGGLDGLLSGPTPTGGPLSVGSVVAPGQPLFTVYDLAGFHAVATVDEIDVVLVEEGQRADVLVDAFPELELSGVVSRVAVAPETTAAGGVAYGVDVELTALPSDVDLRIGLTASAEIEVARVDSDRVVPAAALRRRDGSEVVLVVRDGVVRIVPVTVTALGAERAAVDGELERDERVVTVGADGLEDGDRLP